LRAAYAFDTDIGSPCKTTAEKYAIISKG